MPKDIEDRIAMGIFSETNHIFYYLESGMPRLGRSLEQLRTLLLQRRLIRMMGTPDHKVMSYAEAKRNGYTMEPVFTSALVRETWEQEQTKAKNKTSGW
jgi:hypothetical protein